MKNATGFDIMMVRLGNRKEPELRADLLNEVNKKIDERERGSFLPWFLEQSYLGTLTAGQGYLTLPTDFLREAEDGTVWLTHPTTGAVKELGKGYVEQLEREYKTVENDWPQGYAIYGNQMVLAPAPDVDYVIEFHYFSESAEVTDDPNQDADGWWEYAYNYISYDVLTDVAANVLQDSEMAGKFKTFAAESRRELFNYNESRQHSNADYHIGGMN